MCRDRLVLDSSVSLKERKGSPCLKSRDLVERVGVCVWLLSFIVMHVHVYVNVCVCASACVSA